MRRIVIILCLAYAILFAWLWHDVTTASNDAAGYGMATGFLTIGMWITAIFAGPGLLLALLDKWPRIALTLALIPAFLMVLAKMTDVI